MSISLIITKSEMFTRDQVSSPGFLLPCCHHQSCFRHKQVLSELVRTEREYIQDLETILAGYKERMSSRHMEHKAELIFGNMDQLLLFHKQVLLHQMENANANDNPRNVATIFIEHSEEILKIYCR